MEWRPLTLNDKILFDQALKSAPLELSDYSFTNLWIWNLSRQYQFAEIDNFLCVRYRENGCSMHLYPIGSGSRRSLIEKFLHSEHPFHMRAIPEIGLEALQGLPLTVREEIHRFDYIYAFNDLLNLHGNHFQAKRNFIHQFERNYHFEYKEITPQLIPKVIKMEIEWFNEQKNPLPSLDLEHRGILSALENFGSLNIYGGALLVEDQMAAYSFAEYLTKEMLLIHVEKSLKEFKGGYAMINQQILKHLSPVPFINREEDLGLDNLTKIKESYHPVQKTKKYTFNSD